MCVLCLRVHADVHFACSVSDLQRLQQGLFACLGPRSLSNIVIISNSNFAIITLINNVANNECTANTQRTIHTSNNIVGDSDAKLSSASVLVQTS